MAAGPGPGAWVTEGDGAPVLTGGATGPGVGCCSEICKLVKTSSKIWMRIRHLLELMSVEEPEALAVVVAQEAAVALALVVVVVAVLEVAAAPVPEPGAELELEAALVLPLQISVVALRHTQAQAQSCRVDQPQHDRYLLQRD